jgi:hypothetical protein
MFFSREDQQEAQQPLVSLSESGGTPENDPQAEEEAYPSVRSQLVRNAKIPQNYFNVLRWLGYLPFRDIEEPLLRDRVFSFGRLFTLPALCVLVLTQIAANRIPLRGGNLIHFSHPKQGEAFNIAVLVCISFVLGIFSLWWVGGSQWIGHKRGLHTVLALIDDEKELDKLGNWHIGLIIAGSIVATLIAQTFWVLTMGKQSGNVTMGQIVGVQVICFFCTLITAVYALAAADILVFTCHAHVLCAKLFNRRLKDCYRKRRVPSKDEVHELILHHSMIIDAVKASSTTWSVHIAGALIVGAITVLLCAGTIYEGYGVYNHLNALVIVGGIVCALLYSLVIVGQANLSVIAEANRLYPLHQHLADDEEKELFLNELNTLMAYLTTANPHWVCILEVTADKAALVFSLLFSVITFIIPKLPSLY